MKVTMTGRKCSLRPSFVERTETKLSKLDKFFESDAKADVTVTSERNLMRVEITIRYNGMVFRAEEAAEDPGEAVDRLMDVLLRQIRKNKTRQTPGCRRSDPADEPDRASVLYVPQWGNRRDQCGIPPPRRPLRPAGTRRGIGPEPIQKRTAAARGRSFLYRKTTRLPRGLRNPSGSHFCHKQR